MIKKFSCGETPPKLISYLESTFGPEDGILARIRENTARLKMPMIQVSPFDGRHLEVLARAIQAKKMVEIGTLAGYSGTILARTLPQGGILHTFELQPDQAKTAEEHFRMAEVADRVKVHVGIALKELPRIEAEGPFDLVFIDADKSSYPSYYQWAKKNLRKGGLIIGDNTLAFGHVADTEYPSEEIAMAAKGIREFNRLVAQDGAFVGTLLPTGEGLTVGVRN